MPRIIIDYDTDTIGEDTSTTDVITALEALLPYVFSNVIVRDPNVDASVGETIAGLYDALSWLETFSGEPEAFDSDREQGYARYDFLHATLNRALKELET